MGSWRSLRTSSSAIVEGLVRKPVTAGPEDPVRAARRRSRAGGQCVSFLRSHDRPSVALQADGITGIVDEHVVQGRVRLPGTEPSVRPACRRATTSPRCMIATRSHRSSASSM